MSKIVFFSIPAHGHTNPTIPVVTELVNKGHQVWYFSFLKFQKKIEEAGATFIACDEFLPNVASNELERKVGRDFAALIEMVADTTIAMEKEVCQQLRDIQPDCIVSDSLCIWGKLFAKKLEIPYICSTTSFAFNQHTAKLMKQGFREIWRMMIGMRRINTKIKLLNDHGFQVENFVSLIQNDNETDTIVFTSKEFQPMSGTFSERYSFVGPSIGKYTPNILDKSNRKVIYISLGTVLNRQEDFYQNCIQAFANTEYDVVMSVGEKTHISSIGPIPENFTVKNTVDQITVLQKADVFITHCGMNSTSESLYFGVPLVLFPQHSEQRLIADRVVELGAGVYLKGKQPKNLASAVAEVMANETYQHAACKLSDSFRKAGGAAEAVKVILTKIDANLNIKNTVL